MYRSFVRTFSARARIPGRAAENPVRARAVPVGPSVESAARLGHAVERLLPSPAGIRVPLQRAGGPDDEPEKEEPAVKRLRSDQGPIAQDRPASPRRAAPNLAALQAGPHGGKRKRDDEPTKARGSEKAADPEPPRLLTAKQAYDAASELPEVLSAQAGGLFTPRARVVSAHGQAFLSGAGDASEEFLAEVKARGLTFAKTRPLENRAQEIGHVFTGDQPSTRGAPWHPDTLGINRSDAIGDSLRECNSCQNFSERETVASGKKKAVRDPEFSRRWEPLGENAFRAGQRGPGASGFGRALVKKSAVKAKPGKPAERQEQVLAFPGGVSFAEQRRRPGGAIVRVPNTARLRLPADVGSSNHPKLLRRPPRPSLNQKPAEEGNFGEILKQERDRRKILFKTDEGDLKVTTEGGSLTRLKLASSLKSLATPGTFKVRRGVSGLISGQASVHPQGGEPLVLPPLADPLAPRPEAATSAGPPPDFDDRSAEEKVLDQFRLDGDEGGPL